MRTAAAAVIAASIIVLAGCAGGGDAGDGRDCHDVDPEIMAAIAEGANDVAITPVAAAAVESDSFTDAYIVAMSFTAPGVDDSEVGVWAVASLEPPGAPFLAVDGFAHQFTDWPNEIRGEKLTASEDGVTEAKACLDAG